jgi:hypothetical protein
LTFYVKEVVWRCQCGLLNLQIFFFPRVLYDFSSSEWEMMEESTLIDWQQVGKPGQSCAAEHFTLDPNLNLLREQAPSASFTSAGELRDKRESTPAPAGQ